VKPAEVSLSEVRKAGKGLARLVLGSAIVSRLRDVLATVAANGTEHAACTAGKFGCQPSCTHALCSSQANFLLPVCWLRAATYSKGEGLDAGRASQHSID
jgi:hypothetical protein